MGEDGTAQQHEHLECSKIVLESDAQASPDASRSTWTYKAGILYSRRFLKIQF